MRSSGTGRRLKPFRGLGDCEQSWRSYSRSMRMRRIPSWSFGLGWAALGELGGERSAFGRREVAAGAALAAGPASRFGDASTLEERDDHPTRTAPRSVGAASAEGPARSRRGRLPRVAQKPWHGEPPVSALESDRRARQEQRRRGYRSAVVSSSDAGSRQTARHAPSPRQVAKVGSGEAAPLLGVEVRGAVAEHRIEASVGYLFNWLVGGRAATPTPRRAPICSAASRLRTSCRAIRVEVRSPPNRLSTLALARR